MIAKLIAAILILMGISSVLITGVLSAARQAEPQSPGVAFLSSVDNRNLYLHFASFDGSFTRQLDTSPLILQNLTWSPDGKWIIYSKRQSRFQTDLYRIPPNGKTGEQITFTEGNHSSPTWSPDGQYLLFQFFTESYNSRVYRMSIATLQEEQLTQRNQHGIYPVWSPSGQYIVYSARSLGDNMQFYRIDPDGGNVTTLFYAYQGITNWSPDSQFVVFTVHTSSGTDLDIFRTDVESKRTLQLTNSFGVNAYPVWSPKGDWIAFTSSRDGNSEIYRMRPDGSQQERLTHNGVENLNPTWSPDGKWIAYISNRYGTWDVFRIDADGGNPTRLTTFIGNDLNPAWSPVIDMPWRWLWLTGLSALFLLGSFLPLHTRA